MSLFYRHNFPASFGDGDESALLKRFLKGDDEAFAILYDRYVDQLFSYGKGFGFDEDCLRDAIHDVFCKLYTDRKLLSNISNLKSYLFKSLKNHLWNDLKKDTQHVSLTYEEKDFTLKVNVLDALIEEEDRIYIEQTLEKFFGCLTSRQKEAIYLRFIQEMDYEEIALQLDMTPHGVRKLVSRAMARIREQQSPISPLVLYYFLKNK